MPFAIGVAPHAAALGYFWYDALHISTTSRSSERAPLVATPQQPAHGRGCASSQLQMLRPMSVVRFPGK
jgi:hypothetical protein